MGVAEGGRIFEAVTDEPVEADMHRIGGSHAQWEIYEETMVHCYLALERFDDATRLLHLLYSFILVSYAVNVFNQNRIPDSGAAFFDMVAEPAV